MAYVKLGPRTVTAAADQTGKNAGNLTTAFTGVTWSTNVAYFELYHMVISSVPVGAYANIYVNNQPWGFTFPNLGSEWDPTQPILLTPTDEVDFLWNVVAATTPLPVTTAWIRYDPAAQTAAAGAAAI